jgi:hypothetical protein
VGEGLDILLAQAKGYLGHCRIAAPAANSRLIILQRLDQNLLALPSQARNFTLTGKTWQMAICAPTGSGELGASQAQLWAVSASFCTRVAGKDAK